MHLSNIDVSPTEGDIDSVTVAVQRPNTEGPLNITITHDKGLNELRVIRHGEPTADPAGPADECVWSILLGPRS